MPRRLVVPVISLVVRHWTRFTARAATRCNHRVELIQDARAEEGVDLLLAAVAILTVTPMAESSRPRSVAVARVAIHPRRVEAPQVSPAVETVTTTLMPMTRDAPTLKR